MVKPGASSLRNAEVDEKAMAHTEAIILVHDRQRSANSRTFLNGSRRKSVSPPAAELPSRKSTGFLEQYEQMNKMMKQLTAQYGGQKAKKRKMKIPFSM